MIDELPATAEVRAELPRLTARERREALDQAGRYAGQRFVQIISAACRALPPTRELADLIAAGADEFAFGMAAQLRAAGCHDTDLRRWRRAFDAAVERREGSATEMC